MAKPSSLPFNSGITLPTALAAPVVVGIMFIAAARARLDAMIPERQTLENLFVKNAGR